MQLTEDQTNAMDLIAVEVLEFTEMCINQETALNGLEKGRLPFSVFLKCLCDQINSHNETFREALSMVAINVIRGYQDQ